MLSLRTPRATILLIESTTAQMFKTATIVPKRQASTANSIALKQASNTANTMTTFSQSTRYNNNNINNGCLKSTTSPLRNVSGNVVKAQSRTKDVNDFMKRTTSGLTRVLSQQNGFDDQVFDSIPSNSTKLNKTNKTKNSFELDGFVVDENDFMSDSEWEMDVAPVISKPVTSVPVSFPSTQPKSIPSKSVSQSEKKTRSDYISPSNIIDLTQPTKESLQKMVQAKTMASYEPPATDTSASIPWSSSPEWHRDTLAQDLSQIRKIVPPQTPAPIPKVQKRKLPWKTDQEEEEEIKSLWDISQSAFKRQKQTVREAKRRVKVTESEHGKTAAIAKKKKSSVARLFLSDEQQAILGMVTDKNQSVFFTGSAGTGKSVLLREIIATLKKKYIKNPDAIAITASTGLAACNIGGITLHSFAGIGLGKGTVSELVKKIKKNQKTKIRWTKCQVLVIDEVSMVDGQLFDKLEEIARELRKNGRPFGGIQLVITGDFFQLPPVPDSGRASSFAFDARSWKTSIPHTIALHKVFRQSDPKFASMLNQMREGRLDSYTIAQFKNLSRELKFDDDIDATELFSTRAEVDKANILRMQSLKGDTHIYEANDGGSIKDITYRNKLLSNLMAPERLTLKQGCQVMLIKNIDETLVNGSVGKVIGFMSTKQFNNYFEREDFQSTQGGTILEDWATGAPNKVVVNGLGSGLGVDKSDRIPVVRFNIADGTTRDFLCDRNQWTIEQSNGEVQASRSQIPLILAWALSIHKAQGQTLERVKVNLSKAFEKGQAYVALSRATSMNGLQVIGFEAHKVQVHEAVRRFYLSLSKMEAGGKFAKSEPHNPHSLRNARQEAMEQIKHDDVDGMFDFDDPSEWS